jgi:tripartite-type tricarboxylate transporter receptor subunit TctC
VGAGQRAPARHNDEEAVMRKLFSLQRAACLCAFAGFGILLPAASTAGEVSFAGKRIEVIVPFAPGGGTDVYVRALAPHLERYLPGNPTIVVRNVPGARGIPGANQFEARAKPDGLEIIAASASTVANFVFQKSKVDYHMDKWEPVLLSPQGAVVYAAASLGLTGPSDVAKLKGKELVFGGQSAASAELRAILTFELLGLKPKYVWGMNRGPVRLAFERGEMNINYDSTPGYLKGAYQLVKAGKAVPLYALGVLDDKGNLARDPNFADMPNFAEAYELMHGKKPSGQGYEAWLSVMKMLVMLNKGLYLPTGTPKPVQAVWQNAVKQMLGDPEFEKSAGMVIEGYPQFIGDAGRPIIKDATTFSPQAWEWITKYLKSSHDVTVQ